MSRRSLGPANDRGVPADELYLAKLVQNMKARGLRVLHGPKYAVRGGGDVLDYQDDVYAACAIGAADLEPDTRRVGSSDGLIAGHEWPDTTSPVNYDKPLFQAGVAFEDAVGGRVYR